MIVDFYFYFFRNGVVIGFHLTSFWYIEKTSKKSETTISQIKEVPVPEIKQSDEVLLPMRKNSFLRHIIWIWLPIKTFSINCVGVDILCLISIYPATYCPFNINILQFHTDNTYVICGKPLKKYSCVIRVSRIRRSCKA